MPGVTPAILAHQGGWDEILFVLVPIALFAGLLALANRRAAQAFAERDDERDDERGTAPIEPAGRADRPAAGAGRHRADRARHDGDGDQPPS